MRSMSGNDRIGQRYVPGWNRLSPAGRTLATMLFSLAAVGGLVSGIVVRNVTTPSVAPPHMDTKPLVRLQQSTATPIPTATRVLEPSRIITSITAIDGLVSPGGTLHVTAQVVLASDKQTPVVHIPCVLSFPPYHGKAFAVQLTPQMATQLTDENGQCRFAVAVPNDVTDGSYYARVLARWGSYFYWYESVFSVQGDD
jgi:hypothetical protein